jgi:hypothetical protein
MTASLRFPYLDTTAAKISNSCQALLSLPWAGFGFEAGAGLVAVVVVGADIFIW